MGVVLQRNSYTACEDIADKFKMSVSKVILIIKAYQNKILFYVERGEKVPISGITTLKVHHDTVVYEVDGKYRSRTVTGSIDLNTTLLSSEIAESLKFTKKEVYNVIKEYLDILVNRLAEGKPVYINGLISLYTEQGAGTLLVRSSVSHSLRKRIREKGFENVYARTSEKLKSTIYQKTAGIQG